MGKGKLGLLLSVALVFVPALGLVVAPAVAQPEVKANVLIGFTQTPGAAEEGLVTWRRWCNQVYPPSRPSYRNIGSRSSHPWTGT